MARDRRKKSSVNTLRAKSVAPGKAKRIKGGPSGQPWRGSLLGRASEKAGE